MENKVTVSVIMGVYNPKDQQRFFAAVDSIIHQSFTDWEFILYDDGSQIPYADCVCEAAKRDGRIRYLRGEENQGLGYGLNVCIRHAQGDYIARMDDDDISRPDRLERQLEFLQGHPEYQWVGSNAELVDEQGAWGFLKMPETPQAKDFLFYSPYIHPSVLFRREELFQNGGYRSGRDILQCEDYELFMRLHRNGGRGYNLQLPLLRYWENRESYQKRGYRRRIREMKVRYRGFQELGVLNGQTLPYVVKPLLVGIVPSSVQHALKKSLRNRGQKNIPWKEGEPWSV
jgi:glycosyltransferase EpsE